MVQLQNLKISFGGRELYRDVNLFAGPGSRVGLVGPNGSGKSTLFHIIRRELEPEEGSVDILRGLRISHLPQTGVVLKNRSVLAEALAAFGDVQHVEEELVRLERALHQRKEGDPELPRLLERYSHLREERDHAGYAHESDAKRVLADLGFHEDDFEKPTSFSSGGFQVRIALAKLILEEPDLLLLDEPTNYLDIKAIARLQDYLESFKGAYILITHDRYLLDACVDRIWAIEKPTIVIFKGNYSGYQEDKAGRGERLVKSAEQQQKEIKKAERFIEQFRARKDTARRVKSRMKALEKMEIITLPEKRKRIRIRFPEAATIYGQAISIRDVAHRFGEKRVLAGVNLTVAGGERIALFGANGEGKTTLLRILTGELEPSQGSVWQSEKLQLAFYRQGAEELLDNDLDVIDEVQKDAEGFTLLELRTILGAFLFPGDDIYKSVGVLSGGERTRLAILKILLRPSNLLVLDEPTNHLDIESREVLEEAISDYQNTVIFSAHDRFMIDRLATKTIWVRDGHAGLFLGNYTYATSARGKTGPVAGREAARPAQTATHKPQPAASVAQRPAGAPAPKPKPKPPPPQLSPEEQAAARLRRQIEEKEARVKDLEDRFNEAKRKFDFVLARDLWTERQALIDELIALRSQD